MFVDFNRRLLIQNKFRVGVVVYRTNPILLKNLYAIVLLLRHADLTFISFESNASIILIAPL